MLAFSTNAFTRFPLATAVDAIADAGFAAIEILADKPHAFVREFSAADVRALREQLQRRRLQVSNVNANCTFGYWPGAPGEPYFEPSLISPNKKHRDDRRGMILATLDLAKGIGASNISITSGRCLGGAPPDVAATLFIENIRPILDRADALRIDVGIELEPGLFLEAVTELRDWIGRLGSPRFGANLDIGHSVVAGERIDESILTLAGRIWNLHVEDLPGRKHYHTIPGRGTLDWTTLEATLRQVGYDRGITIELYTETAEPAQAAQQSYEYLTSIGFS